MHQITLYKYIYKKTNPAKTEFKPSVQIMSLTTFPVFNNQKILKYRPVDFFSVSFLPEVKTYSSKT